MPRPTIHDLYEAQKSGKQLAQLFSSRLDEVRAINEAEIDILVCAGTNVASFRKAAPDVFICGAMGVHDPEIATPADCVRRGFACLQAGGDAVYTGMGLKCIEAMANESIPVIGHVGLVPYRSSWFGGMRAVGRRADEAIDVYRKVKAYEDAGALGVEMEVVPSRVLDEIIKRTSILVVSMGSGTAGASQYLFATDVLGTNTGHVPRHAKTYANLRVEEERLHQLRVDAFRQFKQEVSEGIYPEPKHTLTIKDEEFDRFLAGLD